MKKSIIVLIGILVLALTCLAQQNNPTMPLRTGKHYISASKMGGIGDLPQLLVKSDLIIDGTVDKVLYADRSDPGKRNSIRTYTQISVNKVIRGEIPKNQHNVAIVELGGKIDGYEVVYTNNPVVQPGEHYLLFLSPFQKQQDAIVPDLGMPLYSIAGEEAGKAKITKQGTIQATAAPFHDSDGMDLEAFLAKMKRATGMIERAQAPRPFPQDGVSNPSDNSRPSFMIPKQ
jgi:hypothetical protein